MKMVNLFKKDIKYVFSSFSSSSLFYNFLIEVIPKIGIAIEELESLTNYKIQPIPNGERVTLIRVYKLWVSIEKVSQRSDIGLIIADYFTTSKAGIIGELFLGTKNLRESVRIIKRFLSLMIDNINFKYEEIQDEAIFYFDVVPRFLIPLSATECYIKICYNWVIEYNNSNTIPVKEINFYKPKPKHFRFYELNFPKAKVYFNQSKNFIIVKKHIFYKENKNALSMSYNYTLKYAQNMENKIFKNFSFTQKVINLILINLPEGESCISTIAKNLNVSTSTIKRKLHNENKNFKELVEEARKELSVLMLEDESITYEEISYLLGYSQYSPFFRAFKKWHNCSPSVYRKKLLNRKF